VDLLSQGGSKADFAREVDVSQAHLYQMRTGRRNVGDKIARRIEKRKRLPEGWMDHDHAPEGLEEALGHHVLSDEARGVADVWDSLPENVRHALLAFLNTMVAEGSPTLRRLYANANAAAQKIINPHLEKSQRRARARSKPKP